MKKKTFDIVPTEKCNPLCTREFFPVCDSKGKTHSNKCLFEFAACKAAEKGEILTMIHEGPCKGKITYSHIKHI